jgi:hypothetical protein
MRVCLVNLCSMGKKSHFYNMHTSLSRTWLFYDCGKQESGRATFIVGVRIRRANELLELSETGAVGDIMKLVCLEDFYFMLMAGVLRVYLFRMILLCN